jgi:hypothetical protein
LQIATLYLMRSARTVSTKQLRSRDFSASALNTLMSIIADSMYGARYTTVPTLGPTQILYSTNCSADQSFERGVLPQLGRRSTYGETRAVQYGTPARLRPDEIQYMHVGAGRARSSRSCKRLGAERTIDTAKRSFFAMRSALLGSGAVGSV